MIPDVYEAILNVYDTIWSLYEAIRNVNETILSVNETIRNGQRGSEDRKQGFGRCKRGVGRCNGGKYLTLCIYNAQCQDMYFDRLYDFGNGYADGSAGVIKDSVDESWYFVVRSIDLSTNNSKGILCKIDVTGDTIFTMKIEELNKSFTSTKLKKTIDNGIVIGSTVRNTTSNKSDYSLIKISEDNEIAFSKSYGDSINNEQLQNIINTNDNGFLIVGQSVVPPNDSAEMYAVKTDSIGNFEWEKHYGGNSFEAASSVIQTPDSGYVLFGFTQSFGNGGTDWYLVKTDKNGNQEWQKTYGSSSGDTGLDIIATSDGSYLLTGTTGGGGFSNGVFRKVDSLGNLIWIKSYSHESNPKNNTRKTVELADGSLVSAGMTHVTDDAGWLIKTDSIGNKIWSRMYNKSSNTDLFYDFITTDDSGFLMAGLAWNVDNGSQDAWLLKVDSMGCEYENCTVGIDEESKKVMVDVWPNPVSEVLNIELQENKEYDLTVSDLQGKVVYESIVHSRQSIVNVSGFANGVYLLTMENEEERTTVKIVVQH